MLNSSANTQKESRALERETEKRDLWAEEPRGGHGCEQGCVCRDECLYYLGEIVEILEEMAAYLARR